MGVILEIKIIYLLLKYIYLIFKFFKELGIYFILLYIQNLLFLIIIDYIKIYNFSENLIYMFYI